MSIIKKKKSNNKKYIVLFFITILIMFVLIIVILKFIKPNSTTGKIIPMISSDDTQNQSEEMTEDEEIRNLDESLRIKRYIGIFFENIEEGKYQEAYNKLNKEFKGTYFPTLEEFTTYARKHFRFENNNTIVTYKNIERLGNSKTGNMYVTWLLIDKIIQPQKTDVQKEQEQYTNFVVIEYDYNNYEMSFSVIGEE